MKKGRFGLDMKKNYTLKTGFFFIFTVLLVGFAIVALVQGIVIQFQGVIVPAILFYFASIILVVVSYVSFRKASRMAYVLHSSRR